MNRPELLRAHDLVAPADSANRLRVRVTRRAAEPAESPASRLDDLVVRDLGAKKAVTFFVIEMSGDSPHTIMIGLENHEE